jgi:hypothetical protein
MASELRTTYSGDAATVYAVIRRVSDAYVWNGSTFEAWVNGNIATYDIAMTAKGGDLYQADFPSSIVAGQYLVYYYSQAGGTPAITDFIIGSEARTWNGASLSDPGDATLSQYALCSLAEAKRYRHITTTANDQLITELINAMTDRIENLAGRHFKARNFVTWYNGTSTDSLPLREYPVLSVKRVAYGAQTAFTVKYSGAAIQATVQVDSDSLTLRSVNTSGVETSNDLTFATYPSVSLLVSAINAVSGWTATLNTDWPSDELHVLPGINADETAVEITYPDAGARYRLDAQLGTITTLNNPQFFYGDSYRYNALQGNITEYPPPGSMEHGRQSILIKYRAGYETIPDDLNLLCRELVAEAFRLSSRDTSIKSESLGSDYSYTLSDQVSITEAQHAKIARYARVAIAA